MHPRGDSLLVSDGGSDNFWVCEMLSSIPFAIWCLIGIFLGLLMRKYDKMSARLSFSPKYCRAVAENSIKPLVFKYHEAISIFLRSKNVLNLVYFWVFQKHIVSDPPRHIRIEVPLGVHERRYQKILVIVKVKLRFLASSAGMAEVAKR